MSQTHSCFRRVRKISWSGYSFVKYELPFVRVEQLGSHSTSFHEIWYLSIFPNCFEKFEILLKLMKITGTLHMYQYTFKTVFTWIVFRMRNISDKSRRENKNTYFLFSNFSFGKSCTLWDNVERYSRSGKATDDNIIWRMHFVCWITKTTDTHSEYVIVIFYSTNV